MKFNKFKDKTKKNSANFSINRPQEGPVRVKLPREKEIIGVITKRCGGSRMMVSGMDGKTRNCRVPGRKRRGLWLREGDAVILEPWEFDDSKGDILFKYSLAAIDRLKKMGKLTTESAEF
tara:strand:- start:467 stop:826 length:360 start_codon:yes stop_codon:yes gene_type:complete